MSEWGGNDQSAISQQSASNQQSDLARSAYHCHGHGHGHGHGQWAILGRAWEMDMHGHGQGAWACIVPRYSTVREKEREPGQTNKAQVVEYSTLLYFTLLYSTRLLVLTCSRLALPATLRCVALRCVCVLNRYSTYTYT